MSAFIFDRQQNGLYNPKRSSFRLFLISSILYNAQHCPSTHARVTGAVWRHWGAGRFENKHNRRSQTKRRTIVVTVRTAATAAPSCRPPRGAAHIRTPVSATDRLALPPTNANEGERLDHASLLVSVLQHFGHERGHRALRYLALYGHYSVGPCGANTSCVWIKERLWNVVSWNQVIRHQGNSRK